jgi:hypothetical protein
MLFLDFFAFARPRRPHNRASPKGPPRQTNHLFERPPPWRHTQTREAFEILRPQ